MAAQLRTSPSRNPGSGPVKMCRLLKEESQIGFKLDGSIFTQCKVGQKKIQPIGLPGHINLLNWAGF